MVTLVKIDSSSLLSALQEPFEAVTYSASENGGFIYFLPIFLSFLNSIDKQPDDQQTDEQQDSQGCPKCCHVLRIIGALWYNLCLKEQQISDVDFAKQPYLHINV